MDDKKKTRIVNIVVITINILLLGVICSNHCRVPNQDTVNNDTTQRVEVVQAKSF